MFNTLTSLTEEWLYALLYDVNVYLSYFVIASLLLLGILSWYYFIYFFLSLLPLKKFPVGEIKFKYAVLVPARNESKVIGNLLQSLKDQDYDSNLFDVYVIVETENDPTIDITKSFGYNYVVRKDLEGKHTKGHALNEAYQYLKENNLVYDSLIIFDADNVVSKNYITLLNDCKNKGYQVVTGYRNFTNASANWISGCSGTLFSFMNQFTSNGRSFFFKKATLTGTGYYIDMNIVDNEGGRIWNGMTEDVELTLYCYYHNISMHYYNYAQYYDEQVTTYKQLHQQHVRWVRGFFARKKKYKKKDKDYGALRPFMKRMALIEYTVSIFPFITFCVMEALAFLLALGVLISSIILGFCYREIWSAIPTFVGFVGLYFSYVYLTFALVAFITFIIDNKRLKFSLFRRISIILTFLFFYADFLFAFLDGLFHKNKRTIWNKIEHKGKIVDKQAKKVMSNEQKTKKKKG